MPFLVRVCAIALFSLTLVLTGCEDEQKPSPYLGVTDLTDTSNNAQDMSGGSGDVSPDVAIDVPTDMVDTTGWQTLAPLAAGSRQENGVVALRGEVVVVGGFRGSIVVADVEAYSPQTDTWRSLAPLPVRMHHPNVAVVNDRLYVLGFLTGLGFVPDQRGFVYDPDTDAWTEIASLPEGRLRGASAMGVVDGKIMVVGGFRGVAVADVSLYDPDTDTWLALPDLPASLDHIVGGVVDGIFYAIGGREVRIESHLPSVYAYDFAQNQAAGTWQERSPMPTSRGGHAAAVWDGKIHVLGGEGNEEHPSGVFEQHEVYDPASDTWSLLGPLKTRRHGTGATAIEGRIYLPGGADVIAFGSIDINESYLIEEP